MNLHIKYLPVILLIIPAFKVAGQTPLPSKFELNIHVTPSVSGLKNNKFVNDETMQMGFIGGFDLAYYFKTIGKLKTGISAGLNYSRYSTGLSLNYNDSLWVSDVDNEQVYLFEKGDNLKETQKAGFVDIPVLLRFDYILSPRIEAYMNAGAYFSVVISKKYSTSTSYTASGYYSEYNALLYNIDVANSPYFYPTGKAMSNDGTLQLNSNMGILAALGLKYWLTPTVAFTAGINSYMGLKNISGYDNTTKNTLVDSQQKINTLMGRSSNIKAIAYGFQLGISISLSPGK
jgi:hypothetical protein